MRPVLFLDIDGVLNSGEYLQRVSRESSESGRPLDRVDDHLDPVAVLRLETILLATDCSVVVSSTWRMTITLGDMVLALRRRGIGERLCTNFVGTTVESWARSVQGLLLGQRRGGEIDAWVRRMGVKRFAILDDDSDMEPHMEKLVKTDNWTGLQDEHVERVIEMIGRRDG